MVSEAVQLTQSLVLPSLGIANIHGPPLLMQSCPASKGRLPCGICVSSGLPAHQPQVSHPSLSRRCLDLSGALKPVPARHMQACWHLHVCFSVCLCVHSHPGQHETLLRLLRPITRASCRRQALLLYWLQATQHPARPVLAEVQRAVPRRRCPQVCPHSMPTFSLEQLLLIGRWRTASRPS